MHARYYSHGPVSVSVTSWSSTKTAKHRIHVCLRYWQPAKVHNSAGAMSRHLLWSQAAMWLDQAWEPAQG